MGMIDDKAAVAHAISRNNGFWDKEVDVDFLLSKLALLHSEVSETLEAIRKEKGEDAILEELSDIFIRLVDFYQGAKQAGWLSATASFDQAIDDKIRINATRPRKHGNLA